MQWGVVIHIWTQPHISHNSIYDSAEKIGVSQYVCIYIYEVSLFIYWCPRLNGHSGAVGGVVEVCEELPLTFHCGGEGVIGHMG